MNIEGKNMAMIEIANLEKRYRNVHALKGISFDIEQGDIFGFIGPNGAGKTTTIKILATLLTADAGSARIGGFDVQEQPDQVRRIMGYMPDDFGVYNDLKVWEYLEFFAAAYRIPVVQRKSIVDDVLELTDLSVKKEAFVNELSRGMKQRLCLARTLVHNPDVLILDEPASGLDPRARIEIRELLKELKNMNKTILISSHILTELSDFCNKIGIIEAGRMIVSGDVKDILSQVSHGRLIKLELAAGQDIVKVMDILRLHNQISDLWDKGPTSIEIQFEGNDDEMANFSEFLVNNKIKFTSIQEAVNDLEDIFLKVTEGKVN